MRSTIIALFAAASAVVSAAPLEARQETCQAYPWFIVPYDSSDCTGDAAAYQPNPGPISSTPTNVYCQTLYDPNQAPTSFGSVAVNRDPCPDQIWTIKLYTDEGCTTEPTVINSDICVPAPDAVNGRWVRFDAVLFEAN